MEYIALLFLFLLGVLMFLKPELLWKLAHLFAVKGEEPTELYLTILRLGGILFAIIAVIVAIYSWV